jgi:type IV/VI secretion system ImpK/VasF family protein
MPERASLFDIASDLFLYLVSFRRKVRKNIHPAEAVVRYKLEEIFDRQQERAGEDPRLEALYKKARFPLVGFADEVMLTSNWAHAESWRGNILEKFYFGTSIAGEKFYEIAEHLEEDEHELARILYVCLSLGFAGRYSPDAPELRALKKKLYRWLPDRLPQGDNKLSPEAYHVSEGDDTGLGAVVNLTRVAIVCVVFCVVYIIINQFLWYDTVKEIHTIAQAVRSQF